jgi:hypothetical protein
MVERLQSLYRALVAGDIEARGKLRMGASQ